MKKFIRHASSIYNHYNDNEHAKTDMYIEHYMLSVAFWLKKH